METIVRATCPTCRSTLRIPAPWVGEIVRCTKCRAAVRSKPRHEDDTPRPGSNGTAVAIPLAPPPVAIPLDGIPMVTAAPLPTDTEFPFAPRYRRRRRKSNIVGIVAGLLVFVGIATGGVFGLIYLIDNQGPNEPTPEPPKPVEPIPNPSPPGNGGTTIAKGPFPRRLLFIQISKYMYLNPLTGIDGTKPAVDLAFQWRVPTDRDNNQVFVLSDSATTNPTIPMRGVVTGTYERFFDTSRAQDRIVVYFGGHALEKDGKAYLAPVEGELDDPNTLIPLGEFYAKLSACKATQKVVIWDVRRFNPERGTQRPGSEPMTESLARALAAAPPGVEVIATCQPGENALEFNNLTVPATPRDLRYSGSVFLKSLQTAPKSATAKAPTPADPIPVAEWTRTIGKRVANVAALPTVGAKQTIKVNGKPRAEQIAFNPDEPPAARFEFPAAPRGTQPEKIIQLAKEFAVPPIKSDLIDTGLADLPFLEKDMKDYMDDVTIDEILKERDKYKFRAAVLDAFQAVREVWGSVPGASDKLDEIVSAPITDAIKRKINAKLEFYAIGIAKLELSNIALDEVESLKVSEPKRWQAHYEYARAVLKTRLAYLNEYNKLMGDVRTETLPPLEKNQNAYKLVSSDRLKSKKDVARLAEEAQEAYARLITEHRGTPWAIQAKREKNFSLGLAWRPISTSEAGSR